MPVVKRPTNPLRAAILRTANRLDAPTQDRSPMEAQLRGFLAGILGGPVADTVAPEAEDAMMQAAMPAMAIQAPVRRTLVKSLDELMGMADSNVPLAKMRLQERAYLDNLKRKIADEGVKQPLTIGHYNGRPIIKDGMHRLAVAEELGLKELPVQYEMPPKVAKLLRNHPKLQEMIDQGYDVSRVLFHGTPAGDIRSMRPSTQGFRGEGVYTTTNPHRAGFFAGDNPGAAIYPTVARGKTMETPRFGWTVPEEELASDLMMPSGLYKDPRYGRSLDRVVQDPARLRSIFANFDPTKMDVNDLMASILGLGAASTLLPRREP